jgi:hypothetical protein
MSTPQYFPAQAPALQGPGPDARAIPLPPAPDAAAVEAKDASAGRHRFDRVLTLLVLALAFLSGSFLARNSDFWFHLATGRLVAGGQFSFGADPFAYTTGQVYWACHSWLFDLGLYALYGLIGGTGLVVLKALLVSTLAGLLLRVRRPGSSVTLPALCATLAVLAMSPRLLLQPVCVSYFLLGLTFWLLWKPHMQTPGAGRSPSAYLLPLVFALWVNVDEWFLLGPVLAALFWLGERLQGRRQTPAWVVPLGFAACLLNPHTFHAFTLATEFSPVLWTSGLRQDPRFQVLFASPWQSAYWHAAGELNAAVLAYFTLTLLGLVSFLLHPQALRGWRLVVWLPFALLAATHARAVPFFAVVAAPITALNFQDFLAGRKRAAEVGFVTLGGRLLLATALLALAFLAWPGWLAGYGRQERHVAWDVQIDPSLQRVTQTLQQWRQQGLLAEGERVFAASVEVAQYGAWFCPGERHFFDHRYPLFPTAATDFETVCRALQHDGEESTTGQTHLIAQAIAAQGLVFPGVGAPAIGQAAIALRVASNDADWQRVLREHGVSVVVFADREPERLFAALRRLAADPEQWPLLHVAGQAVIAGWNQAPPAGGFAPLAFDADRLAFGRQDAPAHRELPSVPKGAPDHLPPRRDFWARLAGPPPPPSWESAAATVYLRYFDESEAPQRQQQLVCSLNAYAASLAGLSAQPCALTGVAHQLVTSHQLLFPHDAAPTFLVANQLGPFFAALVERPPALPLLAVRAARLAVAANPEDSVAWLRLGQAYLQLRNFTCEHSSTGLLPPLVELRHVQIVTALEQALRLNPDLEAAHHELAYLYGQRNHLDRAVEHLREEVRLRRGASPAVGETAEEWAYRRELLEADMGKGEDLVHKRRQAYAAGSRALQGERLRQARLALQHGLARQALDDILLPAPADLLGPPGMTLELELLLSLGRAQEVRDILNDEGFRANKDQLLYLDLPAPKQPNGTALYTIPYHWPAYEWLLALQASAVGDYAQARAALSTIRAGRRHAHERVKRQLREQGHGYLTLLPGLLSGPPVYLPACLAQTARRTQERWAALRAGEVALRTQQADLWVLEGLLALEQGAPDDARLAFAAAQQLAEQPPGAAAAFAGGRIAAGYQAKLNRKE